MPRLPVDSWFWGIFVAACGGRCCACGKGDVKLERGHIFPFALGGSSDFENLIPVCLPCNKKYLKRQTPDNRPADFRERFFLMLGHWMKPQISGSLSKSLGSLILTAKHDENAALINWDACDFGGCTEVFAQSGGTTKRQAESLVQKLVIASRKIDPPPRLPKKQRMTELVGHAMQRGEEIFWGAGLEFLRDQPWLPNVKGADIEFDSWRSLAEHFYVYELRWRERAKPIAEGQSQKREAEKQVHEKRWASLKNYASTVPLYSAIPDADRGFLEAIAAESTTVPWREVTDEELVRVVDILSRYREYERKVRDGEKQSLRDQLHTVWQTCAQVSADVQEQYQSRVKELVVEIDSAPCSKALQGLAQRVQQLSLEVQTECSGGGSAADFL